MTEIAVRADRAAAVQTYRQSTTERLDAWVQQARAVSQIAADICSTSFAPAAYRGKPAEATAAILAGAELGLDPMASLRAFDSISGVPAPKAMTLRAVVQGAGHEVRIVESTPQRAQVAGRRRGDSEWQTSEWTIERAQAMAQYKSNPNWKTLPAQMLVARATAEVCRWIASDAIMGMPYAAEEIDGPEAAPAPVARRLSVADLDTPAAIDAAPAPGPQPDPDAPMLAEQRRHMFALWGDLGFTGDENRATRLDVTAKILGLPELDSSAELTVAEADRVIAALRERKDRMTGGEPS